MVPRVNKESLGKSVPVKMHEESSVKQTLGWLYTFDQKPGDNKAATAIQQQPLNNVPGHNLSQISSMQQFDQFLTSI